MTAYFPSQSEANAFIRKCSKKKKTSRALLLTQWLTNIADDIENIKPGRPALKIVFLIILAESVEKILNSKATSPRRAFKAFFSKTNQDDRIMLLKGIRNFSTNSGNLRFNTILDILYNLRNRVFHEGLYFDFHLNDKAEENMTQTTEGYAGNKFRKQRKVMLDIALSYNQLRDIVVRTALDNIRGNI